jgi:hypothetical protein
LRILIKLLIGGSLVPERSFSEFEVAIGKLKRYKETCLVEISHGLYFETAP